MRFSIIIPVYNRLSEVVELLRSAEQLDANRENFEFVFVDDGSKDGFKDFITNYKSDSKIGIRTFFQSNKGPGAARNLGMENALGEYFIFVDSDCLFPTQWLCEIENALQETPCDAFGGPDGAHPDFSALLKAINYSMTSFIGTGGTRGNKKHVGKFYPRSFNMGIHRNVYERIGGMGKLRHGQDMDYAARIYESGFKVALFHKAFVYHKRRTSIPKFFRQIFNWGVARINLNLLHPGMLKAVHLLPAAVCVGVIFSLLTAIFIPVWGIPLFEAVLCVYLLVCLWAWIESFARYSGGKFSPPAFPYSPNQTHPVGEHLNVKGDYG
jgi:glycosyltransferase involved in cell wall biosynthesis